MRETPLTVLRAGSAIGCAARQEGGRADLA